MNELDREFKYIESFNEFSKYGNVLDLLKVVLDKPDYLSILNKVEMYINNLLNSYDDISDKIDKVLNSKLIATIVTFSNRNCNHSFNKFLPSLYFDSQLNDVSVTGSNYNTCHSYTFKGRWEDCVMKSGELVNSYKTIYRGEFESDKLVKGTVIDKGNISEGEWENNRLIKGKITFKDGHIYEGIFDNIGKLTTGKMTTSTGTIFDVDWQDGNFLRGTMISGSNISTGTFENFINDSKVSTITLKKGKAIYDETGYEGEWFRHKKIKTFKGRAINKYCISDGKFKCIESIDCSNGSIVDSYILIRGRKKYKEGRVFEGGWRYKILDNGIIVDDEFKGTIFVNSSEVFRGNFTAVKDPYGSLKLVLKKGRIDMDNYTYIGDYEIDRYGNTTIFAGTIKNNDNEKVWKGDFIRCSSLEYKFRLLKGKCTVDSIEYIGDFELDKDKYVRFKGVKIDGDKSEKVEDILISINDVIVNNHE